MAVTMTSTLTEELTLFRRTLHQFPELSLEEYETTQRIRDVFGQARH